uniref:Uncharacterized protein n=1 Tax=viral metagenome TaxID=1070528 RepID=A0A6C0ADA6_9ZZZZ
MNYEPWYNTNNKVLKNIITSDVIKPLEQNLIHFVMLVHLCFSCFTTVIFYNNKFFIIILLILMAPFFANVFILIQCKVYKSISNIKTYEYIDGLISSSCILDNITFDTCVDYTKITDKSKNIYFSSNDINKDLSAVVEINLCIKDKNYFPENIILTSYENIKVEGFTGNVYLYNKNIPFFIKYGYIIFPIMGILGFGFLYEIIFWNFYAENKYTVEIRKLVGFEEV